MNEAGVLVSSCDLAHGATGFASLQGEVDALKAENTALRASYATDLASLRTELIAKIDAQKAGPLTCTSSTSCHGARCSSTNWLTRTNCQ